MLSTAIRIAVEAHEGQYDKGGNAYNPHKQFAVSRVACGIAGYRDEQIAPMFKDIGSNVYFLDNRWEELYKE